MSQLQNPCLYIDRDYGTLYHINQVSTWRTFKQHMVLLEDDTMRNRITCLVDSTTDLFASNILYPPPCWLKYVTNSININANIRQQNVSLNEERTLFFKHVDEVLFKEREVFTEPSE